MALSAPSDSAPLHFVAAAAAAAAVVVVVAAAVVVAHEHSSSCSPSPSPSSASLLFRCERPLLIGFLITDGTDGCMHHN